MKKIKMIRKRAFLADCQRKLKYPGRVTANADYWLDEAETQLFNATRPAGNNEGEEDFIFDTRVWLEISCRNSKSGRTESVEIEYKIINK